MQAIELEKDILDIDSDALVYSTNQNLHLSGGVVACLVKKYVYGIQTVLDRYLAVEGVEAVSVGTIVEGHLDSMPWRRVFHTVATDLDYDTDLLKVKNIICEVLERCELDFAIKSVVFSALGCGFGSGTYAEFLNLLNDCLKEYSNETFNVYVAKKI